MSPPSTRTRYASVLAGCYVATDADTVDLDALEKAIADLNAVPGQPGYVTETFCRPVTLLPTAQRRTHRRRPRRHRRRFTRPALEPVLLTSLLEAADRVDSTTGVQMAYVKQWAPRSFRPLELRVPALLAGPGHAVRGDACAVVAGLGEFDLAYLDPPYNQHRYEAELPHLGNAGGLGRPGALRGGLQTDRDPRRSPQPLQLPPDDARRPGPGGAATCRPRRRASPTTTSRGSDLDALIEMCRVRGPRRGPRLPSNRYVGARIGIHNPAGERVGTVGRLRNLEYVVVAG